MDKLAELLTQRELPQKAKAFIADVVDGFRGSRETPMKPPPAAIFQADPPVVGGGSQFAQLVRRLLDSDGATKQNVSHVIVGPTKGSMRAMLQSELNPDEFGGTTLGGVYSLENQGIGINPDDAKQEQATALIHELMHAAGASEKRARSVDNSLGINAPGTRVRQ